ncbi:FAD-dependent oxidoreductase [Pectinatus brassicae]|uniref:NADPH-dependent 2,4-dienoyl-CoA reductase/sulfur reductase-like enzyme/peroxiredoxin family protein/TusA-related sulfurtransferase/rhodanese-related sulfurtransferase n=1 Tax=Pectinatus brassicae TaxID=862415 RepID=A0A840UUL0_9FIRM|nr:FAD-dependent oxidoreductase [Pectinatus brassicae]MBB5336623.1 NADPH-dependent 2,4-dienoyl-CoA reductase/sulfur reductase-like enzyme/peroxiredoxin family protein/TusA-related sulfurtransferase/rhodanese-related sulfurtransferase [Pectinatus brassicae]
MKTVIIGGVAGGATTAARLRRRDESMQIVVLEKGQYISYANCGLPYYIGDVIQDREKLLVQTPEKMRDKFNIDIRVENEVMRIEPEKKVVMVKNLQTGEEYQESYDKLVIATGSSPLRPPIPGIESKHIKTLWTIPDTDIIKQIVTDKKPQEAVVIGGGFIGLEMAENLHEAGIKVTLIEALDQVMAPVDKELAQLLHENIVQNDVELILSDGVKSFEEQADKTVIKLNSGREVAAELIVLSIGVRPNSALAKEAGLALNQRGGIIVDEYMQTDKKDIYAVGDVIEVNEPILKGRTMIPLAGPANKQARICADNIVGDAKRYEGTYGTAIAQVFDMNAASVGMNEKTLQRMGKQKNQDYYVALISQKSHAGYYPDAENMILKMLFTAAGKILGAQIVGQAGVDKRIDTIASVMQLNGDIYGLQQLELAYAPPFSSAKDPVNMLGFVAGNILNGLVKFVSTSEFDELKTDENTVVLDITEDIEYMVYHIEGAVHIPWGQLRQQLNELDKNKKIVVYCAIGVRSYNAARTLMQEGFSDVYVLEGGTGFYKSQHFVKPNIAAAVKSVSKTAEEEKKDEIPQIDIKSLDCTGLQCPGPIMRVNQTVNKMNAGEIVKVAATDMGFIRDISSWCEKTGNTLVKSERDGKKYLAYIRKGQSDTVVKAQPAAVNAAPKGKTMVVFSNDLDKAFASFIIANGAAAMGRPVTMFFTFWGLNILRRNNPPAVKKSFIEKMFGSMMPQGVDKLTISKMNMGGMGTKMMKKIMKDKNVASLDELIAQAQANGVKMIACTMSMDVMGIKKEELIDGVEFGGVAAYLGEAEDSNVNLFI